jgi:methylase of polypeptide subunit release factors
MASRSRGGNPTKDSGRGAPLTPAAPSPPTTLGEQLEWATQVLEAIGAPDPAKEAAALLASVMGSPSRLVKSEGRTSIAASQVDRFLAAIARRTREEPPRS